MKRDMDITKAKRDFLRSRQYRSSYLIIGLIQTGLAIVFGRSLILSINSARELQLPDGVTLSEIYHHSVSTSLVLCGLAIGMTATGMLGVHFLCQGLFENPRDRLLSYLLEKT